MAGRYHAYPEYIDSDIEWFSKVPSHWNKTKFKWIFREKRKTSNIKLQAGSISFGEVVYKNEDNLSPETKNSYQEVLSGELLINPLNLNFDLKSLRTGLSEIDVVVSTGYIVIKISENLNKQYIRWVMHQFDVAHMKTLGSGVRQTINFTDIANSLVFLAPELEQQKIALFLDNETAKINLLITKQKNLIELLIEKRQAIISHAVTCSLNLNVATKHTGIDILGEVPVHWSVASLRRFICKMEQGKSPECDNKPAILKQWGVLKTSCVNNGVFNENENKALPLYIEPHIKYEVKAGDILMSRASGSIKLIGSVARAPSNVRDKILLSDKIFRLFLTKDLNPDFFIHLMASSYMRTLIERAISGAEGMANNITKSSILDFSIPVPPLDEQKAIVEDINSKEECLIKLISSATNALALFEERKLSLISAAVTGKIDVRDYEVVNNV